MTTPPVPRCSCHGASHLARLPALELPFLDATPPRIRCVAPVLIGLLALLGMIQLLGPTLL